jgi:hypothetical protein
MPPGVTDRHIDEAAQEEPPSLAEWLGRGLGTPSPKNCCGKGLKDDPKLNDAPPSKFTDDPDACLARISRRTWPR